MKTIFVVVGCVIMAAAAACAVEGGTMPSGKKALVVYYSRTGNTERVAKDVAARLNADIEKLTDLKSRAGFFGMMSGVKDAIGKKAAQISPLQKDPAGYDLVIIGTPTWGDDMAPAIRAYIGQTKDKLKNAAFFVTGGHTKPEAVVSSLESLSGKKAVASTGLIGQELKDAGTYNARIAAFVEALGRAESPGAPAQAK